jgi:hypothetical protein
VIALWQRSGLGLEPLSREPRPLFAFAFHTAIPYLLTIGAAELRMRMSPSTIPTDRLDRDMYLVLENFSSGPAWRETDEDRTDYHTLISDLLTGQYDHPLRVVAFNPLEGWSRDASADVAEELEQQVAEGREVTGEMVAGGELGLAAERPVTLRQVGMVPKLMG